MTDAAEIARKFVVEDHYAADVPVEERAWYYSIEYEPEKWTRGKHFKNVHLTRSALRNLEVEGLRCLDVGSMEGLVSVLLERRGAKEVVAYDRLNLGDRIEFLKSKGLARFRYLSRFPLVELKSRLEQVTDPVFDIVVFSGVLYHMFDVLSGILMARRHLRTGGVMLFEAAAHSSGEMAAFFNAGGRFLPGDNYWLVSVACLDYLLRFCRLEPLDCYHDLKHGDGARAEVVRIAIPCRAVDAPLGPPGDTWIGVPQVKDFSEWIDWGALRSNERPVGYQADDRGFVRNLRGGLDVHATMLATQPSLTQNAKREIDLPRDAIF